MQFSTGSPPLNSVHKLQPHLCFKSVHLHSNAASCVVDCCSSKGSITRQGCCERATLDHCERLRQQAGAIAASLLLSAGYACAPAEAYNVRLQDVENKAMQAGMQAKRSACRPCPFFSPGLFLEPRRCLHHSMPALCKGHLQINTAMQHHKSRAHLVKSHFSFPTLPGSLYN